jgi:DNA-binding cell septation regulator SpoVG
VNSATFYKNTPNTTSAASARLLKFTPLPGLKATRAFLSVQLPSGLIINDLRLMLGPKGLFWIAMPSVKMTGRDGNPLTDPNGKVRWSPIVEFTDRTTRDRFGEMVIGLVREKHPDALDDEGGP